MAKITRIVGFDNVEKNLKKVAKSHPAALAAALYQEGFSIMAESQKKVPVDTGRLRSTGYVAPPQEGDDAPTVEVGYGTDYGIYVHERTELRHTVGEAKFLEKAVNEAIAGYNRRLLKRTQQNIERGVGVRAISKLFPDRPTD